MKLTTLVVVGLVLKKMENIIKSILAEILYFVMKMKI